jgi:acetyltransferase-like isoleucine patch superfamily enzyme
VRSVPPGTVVAGNPAREIKRTKDVTCREHPGERVYVSE